MHFKRIVILLVIVVLCIALLLSWGEVGWTYDSTLFLAVRLPKVLTLIAASLLLPCAGLLMQILFQNPLAGPDILGVSTTASLAVSASILLIPSIGNVVLHRTLWSLFGSSVSLFILMLILLKKSNRVILLIAGVLISAFSGSFISVLLNMAEAHEVKNFFIWSFGSFHATTMVESAIFLFIALLTIFPIYYLKKDLNFWQQGDLHAHILGVDIGKLKVKILIMTSIQVAIATAFCGPLSFTGLIAPHLSRYYFKTSNFTIILIGSMLWGIIFSSVAEIILTATDGASLTLNAILGIIGSPLTMAFLYSQLKNNKERYL